MKRLKRGEGLSTAFDYRKDPVLEVEQNEKFVLETENNVWGMIKSEKDLPTVDFLKPYSESEPRQLNPVCGPIYVKGARRGDLLEITIDEIIPEDKGITFVQAGFGPLAENTKWPELTKDVTKIIKHVPGPSGTTRDGKAVFNDKLSWNLLPHIGTIGAAPDFEIHSSLSAQIPCAGNFDCRDIREKSKIFINCYHEGALLFLGDVHAGQGDTEWSGTADEVQAEVKLSCRVIKNKKIPFIRIEKEESIIQLFADKPMEEAVHSAIKNLMDWMISDYKMNPLDVYMMLTTNPAFRVRVYQMIRDPLFKYVVGAEIPKEFLP